jgi:deazaflavin-dependent oxidoreductase (nitroreductase family)
MNDDLSWRRLDIRNRAMGQVLRLFNPLARRMISAGLPTGATNVLLSMRGRRSGKIRTVPLGLLELDGRWFVQSAYGETGWVANLRADGEAILTQPGGRQIAVRAIELSAEEAGAILYHALERNRQSLILRAALGPRFRLPIGVLQSWGVRIDDKLEEYVADARRHPLIELCAVGGTPEWTLQLPS